MPELPEVETTRRELSPRIVGRYFLEVRLFWEKAVRTPSPGEFCKRLVGLSIDSIERRGKYLLFRLSNGHALIVHLKMSGALLLRPPSSAPEKHTTAIFGLSGGLEMHFRDQRKFGVMWLVQDIGEVTAELGPEPMARSFTPAVLRRLTSGRRIPIKALLCDQHVLAGIGNMYADEALFHARIHPLTLANTLTQEELERLHRAIREVVRRGIRGRGASTDTYKRPGGESGKAHLEFKVAHRLGESCPTCGAPIQRIRLRGRGTYFCAVCQGHDAHANSIPLPGRRVDDQGRDSRPA